jgi:hypothetical protein
MAEVLVRDTDGGVEVVVDDDIVHTARSNAEAEQLAQWVTFQLDAGSNKQDLLRMLRGEAPRKATGYSGGADAQAGESAPKRKAKPKARPKTRKKVDLSILDGRITQLTRAVKGGGYGDHREALLEAEEAGKARKSAISAIKRRIDKLS